MFVSVMVVNGDAVVDVADVVVPGGSVVVVGGGGVDDLAVGP